MPITVKFRRGTTIESNSFLGEEGELYIDKDKDTVVVHDGVTVGGKPLATESFVQSGLSNKVDKINVSAGTVGSGSAIPVITFNTQGQITSVSTSQIDVADIETRIGGQIATEGYVDSGLSLKADSSSLSAVATTGSYNDLLNKPTNVSSFNNDSDYSTVTYVNNQITTLSTSVNNQLALKANSGDLAAVATSGSYNDLLNKPTDLATQTYVNTQISNLIDFSPATLDTLNELAAALADDPNFATTITNQLALKANTSSLSTVATTGSYNDLLNKPTNFVTTTAFNAVINDLPLIYQPLNSNLTTLASNGFGTTANKIPRYDADGWLQIGSLWKVKEIGSTLYFAYATEGNKMKLDSAGNLTVVGDITAFGTV
jgi:hypothetical protein